MLRYLALFSVLALGSYAAPLRKPVSKPTPVAAPAVLTRWTIDSNHSSANFKIRHMGISWVRGSFSGIIGEVMTNEKDVTQTVVKALIDVNKIDTGNTDRDKHLRGRDFFNVEEFPKMEFVSTKVYRDKKKDLYMSGKLTLHNVTKEVTLKLDGPSQPIKNPKGDFSTGLTATTTLNRKDFGIIYGGLVEGIHMIGEDVQIEIEVELTKPGTPEPASK